MDIVFVEFSPVNATTVVATDFKFYSKYHYLIMVQILSVVLNAGRTKLFDSLR